MGIGFVAQLPYSQVGDKLLLVIPLHLQMQRDCSWMVERGWPHFLSLCKSHSSLQQRHRYQTPLVELTSDSTPYIASLSKQYHVLRTNSPPCSEQIFKRGKQCING